MCTCYAGRVHPDLFTIGGFPVKSFGVLLVAGVLLAVWFARIRARKYGLQPDLIYDAAFWAVVPGVLGARITFIALEWPFFRDNPDQLWSLQFAGLTSFGGLIAGTIGLLVWARIRKVPLLPLLDVMGAPFLLAMAVGRVGCLMNGCCFGRPTELFFGVSFVTTEGTHHPAQLYESALLLISIGVLWMAEKRKLPSGGSCALALVLYGFSRFVYEFWRAGTPEEVRANIASSTYLQGLPITQAQATALVLGLIGAVAYWVLMTRQKSPQART